MKKSDLIFDATNVTYSLGVNPLKMRGRRYGHDGMRCAFSGYKATTRKIALNPLTAMSLLSLPNELLNRIFATVDGLGPNWTTLNLNRSLSVTCRRLHHFGVDKLYSDIQIFRSHDFFKLCETLRSQPDYAERVKSVTMKVQFWRGPMLDEVSCDNVVDMFPQVVLPTLPCCTKLTLDSLGGHCSNDGNATWIGLLRWAELCPALECLSVMCIQTDNLGIAPNEDVNLLMAGLSLPSSLVTLDLGYIDLNAEERRQFWSTCSQWLRNFRINISFGPPELGLLTETAPSRLSLRELKLLNNLPWNELNGEVLDSIAAAYQELVHLTCPLPNNIAWKSSYPNLTTLRFVVPYDDALGRLSSLRDALFDNKFPHLAQLGLSTYGALESRIISSMANKVGITDWCLNQDVTLHFP